MADSTVSLTVNFDAPIVPFDPTFNLMAIDTDGQPKRASGTTLVPGDGTVGLEKMAAGAVSDPGNPLSIATIADALHSDVRQERVKVQATGADAVIRDLRAELGDLPVTAVQYGAAGNASVSDRAAYQAAHDSLPDGGGIIYVPYRDVGYLIDDSINITKPNVAVVADHPDCQKIILAAGHNFNVFEITSDFNFRMHNLGFIVFGSTGTAPNYLVKADTCSRVRCGSITASGTLHSGFYLGGGESALDDITLKGLRATYGIGVDMRTNVEVRQLRRLYFANMPGEECYAGIHFTNGGTLEVTEAHLVHMGVGARIVGDTGSNIFSVVLDRVWCDQAAAAGLLLDGTAGGIQRVRVVNGWMTSSQRGVQVRGGVRGLRLLNNDINDNTYQGVLIEDNSTITGFVAASNEIAGNGADGISVGDNVAGKILINGNTIGPSADWGANTGCAIRLGTSAGDYSIEGNSLVGNTGGALIGHAASTASRIVQNNAGYLNRKASVVSGNTNANGDLVVTHEMDVTPTCVIVTLFGGSATTPQTAHVTAITSVNFTIRCFSGTSAILSSAVSAYWIAEF